MEKRLPAFNGKPLIEIPETIPQVGFLEGDFGKAFLDEYKGRAESDYNGNSKLNVLGYDYNIVKGSNSFAVVLANQILRQEGLRTASQADLERILKINALNLRGTYEDTGLVLRSDKEPNSYLAKDIFRQMKEQGIKPKTPVMIPLNGLELRVDSDSPHGLSFNLTENAERFYTAVAILNEGGKFNSEDIDAESGLPNFVRREGERTLYTRDSGLSRLYLNGNLDADSGDGYLAGSDDDGRVVVVNPAGTQKILNNYLKNLQSQRDKEVAKIDERYKKAERILKGE